MKYLSLLIAGLFISTCSAAQGKIPAYYGQDISFNDSLKNIIRAARLDGTFDVGEDGLEQVSFAVIDLNGDKPVFGGVNFYNFIYPASVYKMFVAMEF